MLPKTKKQVEMLALIEFSLRIMALILFIYLDLQAPFFRRIDKEEIWLYANPRTDSYVPTSLLWPMVTLVPLVTIGSVYLVTHDSVDAGVAVLLVTLLMPLNGIVTNSIKLTVGRPRPDFLYRCFPNGKIPDSAFSGSEIQCTGDADAIVEGRKSFPSGHSSFAFATFGFVFFYLSGKFKTFSSRTRGHLDSYRIAISVLILLVPTLIAISRTCDYHHHWQDVTVGSLIGMVLSWLVYRFYYPPLSSMNCDKPYVMLRKLQHRSPNVSRNDIEGASPFLNASDSTNSF